MLREDKFSIPLQINLRVSAHNALLASQARLFRYIPRGHSAGEFGARFSKACFCRMLTAIEERYPPAAVDDNFSLPGQFLDAFLEMVQGNIDASGDAVRLRFVGRAHVQQQRLLLFCLDILRRCREVDNPFVSK